MTITVVWHISFDGIWLVRIDLAQHDDDDRDDDGDENCFDDENGGDGDQNDGQDHDSDPDDDDPDDDDIAWSCSLTLCALLSDQIGLWGSGSAGPVERERGRVAIPQFSSATNHLYMCGLKKIKKIYKKK